MKNESNQVVLSEEDFRLLSHLTENVSENGNKQEMTLSYELKRAKVVRNDAVPQGTIRLNSKVKVKDLDADKVMTFTIVMPSNADMKQNKISILTPMGAALIGLAVSNKIAWKMPAGIRNLEILEVED